MFLWLHINFEEFFLGERTKAFIFFIYVFQFVTSRAPFGFQ